MFIYLDGSKIDKVVDVVIIGIGEKFYFWDVGLEVFVVSRWVLNFENIFGFLDIGE